MKLFKDVEYGEVFKYESTLYVKVAGFRWNAVRLHDNSRCAIIADDSKVKLENEQ